MMKRINKQFFRFSLILLVLGISNNVISQEIKRCGAMEAMREAYGSDEAMRKDFEKLLETNRQIIKDSRGRNTEVYTIPIVFHILHEYGSEKISKAQVLRQVEILNRDFNAENADSVDIIPEFQGIFGNAFIKFKLAAFDFAGNCTDGIDYIYSHETNIGDDFSKFRQWPRDRYLNVWVVKTIARGGVAGYALYPSATNGNGFFRDGIMILQDYVSDNGTGSISGSRTLTHEIGHYLGLPHTWGDSNEPALADNCSIDDGIEDTPTTKGNSGGCPLYSPECEVIDSIFSLKFQEINLTSGTTDKDTLKHSDFSFGVFTANGVSSNPVADSMFIFDNWELGGATSNNDTSYLNLTGSINLNKYYEISFNLDPNLGYISQGKSIAFDITRNFSGARSLSVRSSENNFSSNLVIAKSADQLNKLKILSNGEVFFNRDTIGTFPRLFVNLPNNNIYNNQPKSYTIRIYAWNAEDSTGSFGIDNFDINTKRGKVENVQNYMNYANCHMMFTDGQVAKMRESLNRTDGQRSNLLTAYVSQITGINLDTPPLCTPSPDFHSTQRFNCAGTTVQFTDMSTRAEVDEYFWEFPGGTPSTSTDANPVITYSENARYPVTLTVTNASGSETITKNDYVVSSAFTDYFGPSMETFNAGIGNHWYLDNSGTLDSYFQLINTNGYDNSKCIKLNNIVLSPNPLYQFSLGQSKDAIITPNFDLSNTSSATFSFKYSYATTSTSSENLTEQINIYSSTDCGKTWTKRRDIKEHILANVGFKLEEHIPTSNSEWATYSTSLLPSWNLLKKNVKFKIEFVASDYSNNLYIDDINIDGVLSSRSIENELAEISVYPNPTSNDLNLNLNFVEERNASVELVDLNGKVLMNIESGKFIGEKIIPISMKNLTNGIYFVRVTGSDFFKIEKIIKQ